jgi:hypoxanthine-DNA glycosylase
MKAKCFNIKVKCFPPIVDSSCKVLILGSMPGKESLLRQKYYAHKRNSFWKIIGEIIDFDLYNSSYSVKKKKLLENKIALWDVFYTCMRKSSMDHDICNEIANDISSFLKKYPNIKYVFFNGKKAGQYKKLIFEYCNDAVILPSTSPANASINYNEKLEMWKKEIKKRI